MFISISVKSELVCLYTTEMKKATGYCKKTKNFHSSKQYSYYQEFLRFNNLRVSLQVLMSLGKIFLLDDDRQDNFFALKSLPIMGSISM